MKRKYPHIGESDTEEPHEPDDHDLEEQDEDDDDEHQGRALDEQGSLADELVRRGRRRESASLLDQVVGGTRLREVDGPSVDIMRAMGLDR